MCFVWKHKVAGLALIALQFSDIAKPNAVYRRVSKLIATGYLKYLHLPDLNGFAVSLTRKGFKRIEDEVDCDKKANYRSNSPTHDFIVSVFIVGLEKLYSPYFSSIYSENELICSSKEWYPGGVPKTEVHRPDGYLLIGDNSTSSVIAVEVEWSRKNKTRYDLLAEFYANRDKVCGFWIAATRSIGTNIANALAKYPKLRNRHIIFVWEDILKDDWDAACFNGVPSELTIANFLQQNIDKNREKLSKTFCLNLLLRPMKVLQNSTTCEDDQNFKNVSQAGVPIVPPSLNITPTDKESHAASSESVASITSLAMEDA